MGDDESGPSGHQPVERVLHDRLTTAVERTGRLVKDKDPRVTQKSTGDRKALALATTQARPALADEGVEPVRQGIDEIRDIRVADRRPHPLLRHGWQPVSDVLPHRPREQQGLLTDYRQGSSVAPQVDRIQVVTIDPDRSRRGPVEADQ